ncbi:hypothetical protein ACIRJM_16280 [Streptomyces sp. NPDC102405]
MRLRDEIDELAVKIYPGVFDNGVLVRTYSEEGLTAGSARGPLALP